MKVLMYKFFDERNIEEEVKRVYEKFRILHSKVVCMDEKSA